VLSGKTIIHGLVVADVEVIAYTQGRRPEIAGSAGGLLDQLFFTGVIRSEGDRFLSAGHMNRIGLRK